MCMLLSIGLRECWHRLERVLMAGDCQAPQKKALLQLPGSISPVVPAMSMYQLLSAVAEARSSWHVCRRSIFRAALSARVFCRPVKINVNCAAWDLADGTARLGLRLFSSETVQPSSNFVQGFTVSMSDADLCRSVENRTLK